MKNTGSQTIIVGIKTQAEITTGIQIKREKYAERQAKNEIDEAKQV